MFGGRIYTLKTGMFYQHKNKNHFSIALKLAIKLILSILVTGVFFLVGIYLFGHYFGGLHSKIKISETENVDPKASITIDFSWPVIPFDFGKAIKISPGEEFDARWENSGKRLVIVPRKFWQPESEYSIVLPGFRNIFLISEGEKRIIFATVKYPKVKSFLPASGTKDIIFDIEDPIKVEFDKPLGNFFAKFDAGPDLSIAFENNQDRTKFNLLPKNKSDIEEGREYKVEVGVKYKYDDSEEYKKIYTSLFETLPLEPQEWEKDLTKRLEQSKKYTRAKIKTGKYIDINLKNQIMSIFENGKLVGAFIISSGKKGMETPKGQFAIKNKADRVWSKKYGLYMPYWMAVASDGSFGIHELPEWPGGYKEGANHLGIPVSHGCIRLGVGSAKTVYDWTSIGTSVVIY